MGFADFLFTAKSAEASELSPRGTGGPAPRFYRWVISSGVTNFSGTDSPRGLLLA